MGVSWGARASELGLPAALPRSGPWPSATSHPYCPQQTENGHISPRAPLFFPPQFSCSCLLCPLLLGHLLHGCLSNAENTVLGPTLQSPTEKPRRQKARRRSPQSPCVPQASLPPVTRVPSEAQPAHHDSSQLPQGWRPNPRPPFLSQQPPLPIVMPSPPPPWRGKVPGGPKTLGLSSFPLGVGRQRIGVLGKPSGTWAGVLGTRGPPASLPSRPGLQDPLGLPSAARVPRGGARPGWGALLASPQHSPAWARGSNNFERIFC